jgi:hypothetical protein
MDVRMTRAILLGLVTLGMACGGQLDTGTAKTPDKPKPGPDGSCPAAQTVCGAGAFALCVNLQTDPNHCGTCDHACSPGIACQGGACQQTVCTGGTSTFSGQATTGPTTDYRRGQQVLADVNGDGRLDLIEWQYDPNVALDTFRVSLGQPGGGSAAPDTYQASFVVGQILPTNANDDGIDDLFVFAESIPGQGEAPARVQVWLGHADGRLTLAGANDLGLVDTSRGEAIAVGDLSGDGWSDFVAPSGTDQHQLDVFLSDSTGALHASQTYTIAGVAAFSVFIRDWNLDGAPDLVVLDGPALEILYNRGDGRFDPPVDCPVLFPTVAGMSVVVEDFNHDGLMDFAFNGNPIRVVLRQSECGFAPVAAYDVPVPTAVPQTMGDLAAGGGVPLMRAADMNGDGQLDLVVTFDLVYNTPLVPGQPVGGVDPSEVGDTYLAVLFGKPDGTFQLQPTVISLGSSTITDLAVGEASGDQRPDVVVSTPTGQTSTWENTCQ